MPQKSNGKEISFDDFGLDDEKPKKKGKKKGTESLPPFSIVLCNKHSYSKNTTNYVYNRSALRFSVSKLLLATVFESLAD